MTYAVGTDIGGTFTDVVLADQESGQLHTAKVLTTPDDPARGVLAGLDQALAAAGIEPGVVTRAVHASTLATNLVLERKGATVGYLATTGFGDLLVIGDDRKGDPEKFDLFHVKQPPIVPRARTREIRERLAADGSVVVPLDEAQAEAAVADLLAETEGLDAVAICFMHAHASGEHEAAVAAMVRRARPDLYVALSSEIWPEYRELPRASTTVMSAYVGPIVTRYVDDLAAQLADRGVAAGLQIMQSNGGIVSAEAMARRPIQMVESGPAAGVMAAAHIGHVTGIDDIIAFDMGGTTAKAGLVRSGQPGVTTDFHVGGSTSSGLKRVPTGYPVKIPVIDLAEVGAGGGSMAHVDSGGVLRVGPESAGSEPGPACYARGGDRPTVTDANLVLGFLDADYFLGGAMPVDPVAAETALARHVGEPLGLSPVEAAAGVHAIVNSNMGSAIRVVTLERGIDPREFTLVASGGAGPAHVVRIAAEFDIPRVVVPANAGVGSAIGLLVSDVRFEHVRTQVMDQDALDLARVREIYADLEAQGEADLAGEHLGGAEVEIVREIDVRYRYQAHELSVPLGEGRIEPAHLEAAAKAFDDLYHQLYGVRQSDPVEFVNYRVKAVGRVRHPDWSIADRADAPPVPHGHRPVVVIESGAVVDTPVYRRPDLLPGHLVEGPAIVEEAQSTTVIPPGYRAEVDAWGSLVIELRASA